MVHSYHSIIIYTYFPNLVPRARDPLGRGTKGFGINHLIIESDWLGRNVTISQMLIIIVQDSGRFIGLREY